MNGILAQTSGGAGNKSNNKIGHGEANKSSSIIYHCFICNSIEHKIYDYLDKDVIHVMFKGKVTMAAPKKETLLSTWFW